MYVGSVQNTDGAEGMEMVLVTPLRTLASSRNSSALVAIIMGTWAVKLLQQKPSVRNWGCRLTQVVL